MILDTAVEALQQLIARSLADELDRTSRRYRLHGMVREAANSATLAQHAEGVHRRLENWETNWRSLRAGAADFQLAFEWALRNASS